MAVAGIDINHPASEHYEDKEASISANAKSDGNHLDPNIVEKRVSIGADTSKMSESSSSKQKEHGSNFQEANSGFRGSTKTSLPDNMMIVETKENNLSRPDEMISELPTMFKGSNPLLVCSSSKTSPGGNVCDRVDTVSVDGSPCREIDHHQIHSHAHDNKQMMQGIHSSGSDGNSHYHISCWNQLADMGCNFSDGASRQFRVPQGSLQRSILKDRTNIGKYSVNNIENTNDRKGKERISSKEESDRDSSHESVESNNSKRLFSKGKRTLSIDLENAESTKRLKKMGDESSCTSLLIGQGSSFLNWITNVAKGFSGSVPKHSQVRGSYAESFKPLSDTKNKELEDPGIGFRSFVQTLYHPGLKSLPWTISESHDGKEEFGQVKPLQVSIIPADRIHSKDEFKLEQPVPISCRRPEQCFGETPPATVPKISSSNSLFHGRNHILANEHPDLCNWGSSGSSIQNSSVPAPNGSISPHISSGGSEYLGSLWIARLCRKPATKSPEQDNPDASSAADRQVEDTTRHLDQPHVENLPPKEANLMKINDCSSSEEQVNTLTNEHLPSTSDNCFPKGICRVQKLKSKLNPILPSQRLKKIEPMATIFAKRLDALRNIKSSRLTDDVNNSSSTCFFCGRIGHWLNECSEIKEYERDDILSKVTSFDTSQETSFCIRCFRINHWAVACPYESGKQKHKQFQGNSQTNFVDADCKQLPARNAYFTSFEAATKSKRSEDQNRILNMQNMPGSETSNSRAASVFVHGGRIEPHDNKYLSDNSKMCGMHLASSSKNIKLEGGQKTQELPVYNSFKQARVYELVRGLRLSRSDVVRMKTSTILGSALEGFYLRIRCGKWLDSQTGVDYHVACISGTTSDKPHGSSRHHISVDIGGTKCLVDCRVVSNHDFLEDELDLWWSQTWRNSGILPTEEALTKKLLERRKLDCLAASGSLLFREGN